MSRYNDSLHGVTRLAFVKRVMSDPVYAHLRGNVGGVFDFLFDNQRKLHEPEDDPDFWYEVGFYFGARCEICGRISSFRASATDISVCFRCSEVAGSRSNVGVPEIRGATIVAKLLTKPKLILNTIGQGNLNSGHHTTALCDRPQKRLDKREFRKVSANQRSLVNISRRHRFKNNADRTLYVMCLQGHQAYDSARNCQGSYSRLIDQGAIGIVFETGFYKAFAWPPRTETHRQRRKSSTKQALSLLRKQAA